MSVTGCVVLTREPPDNDELADRLRAAGYRVMEYPCIRTRVVPVGPEDIRNLEHCAVAAFTSRRAVAALCSVPGTRERLACAAVLLGAVGPATAEAIRRAFGRAADVEAEEHDAPSLAAGILSRLAGSPGAAVAHIRGSRSLPDLARILNVGGCRVLDLVVYETAVGPVGSLSAPRGAVVVLASPTAVDGFLAANRARASRYRYAVIGGRTGRRLEERGLRACDTAERPTVECLAAAVKVAMGGGRAMRDRPRSRELYRRAARLIPGGVNSPVRAFRQVGGEPVYIRSASGSRITDADGETYVDYCMSWGPLILGHARPEVVEAVREAALGGLTFGACHEREIQLAELILLGFPGMDRVRLVSTGTEAVMAAVRLARAVTGRPRVVKFDGGYHGHADGMLVRAGSGLATHAIASSEGVPGEIARLTSVLPFDEPQALEDLFASVGDEIAAVVLEPLPANNGLLPQQAGFLQRLRERTRDRGALLIADEVITGFRLGYGGYAALAGLEPDLVTLGKIIGGGMPIGAVVGPAAIMDRLSPLGRVYQAGTLSGNPVSLAAGLATLELLRKDPPYERLDRMGARLEQSLFRCGLPNARAARVGSIVWLYLETGELPRRADRISGSAMRRFTAMHASLLDAGHYLPPSSYEVLFLSTAHEDAEVERLGLDVGTLLGGGTL